MTFEVGQTVVYPHHGAATIEKITTRKLKGEDTEYLTLHVTQGDLVIQVPASNVEMVGLRDVVDEDGLAEVKRVLREPYVEEPTNWSRRYKANDEKIATGDVLKVSEVVRDLSFRDSGRGLSAGEKRMLAKARQILISELALAKDVEEEEAESRLDKILAENLPEIDKETGEPIVKADEADKAGDADKGEADKTETKKADKAEA